jgi:hypothetical protein
VSSTSSSAAPLKIPKLTLESLKQANTKKRKTPTKNDESELGLPPKVKRSSPFIKSDEDTNDDDDDASSSTTTLGCEVSVFSSSPSSPLFDDSFYDPTKMSSTSDPVWNFDLGISTSPAKNVRSESNIEETASEIKERMPSLSSSSPSFPTFTNQIHMELLLRSTIALAQCNNDDFLELSKSLPSPFDVQREFIYPIPIDINHFIDEMWQRNSEIVASLEATLRLLNNEKSMS